ncbi:MAG: Ada metal-binding domain-containing protein [Methanothrix sp.]
MAMFCITGCLEQSPELSVTSSVPQDQSANPALQMDFDAELRSDLFGVRGNIMLPGNSSLAYLMLNASLCKGDSVLFNTKYLLMQLDPNRDYSFEITKNVKIPAGEYDCTLEAKGPQGVLAEESRRITLVSGQEPVFEQVPWPVDLDEEVFRQENEDVRSKEESTVQEEISKDLAGKKDPAVTAKRASTSAGGSLQASTTLSRGNGTFMGSITSKKYHRLDCRYALKIKPENRIYFQSVEDAEGQGYLPCKSCNP